MAMTINRNWLLLAGALALGAIAFYLSNKSISDKLLEIELAATKGRKQVTVIVADKDLVPGDVISESVLAERNIPAEFVNASTIRKETYGSVLDQSLLVGVKRGEPILTSYTASRGGALFSGVIKKGRRALTLEVDELNSFSQMLRPGDRVDLILTARAPAGYPATEGEVTVPFLSNIEVLATGQVAKQGDNQGEISKGYGHVTLDVSPEEASQIVAARNGGKISALLRTAGETGKNPASLTSLNSVVSGIVGFGAPARPDETQSARMVQVIVGGSGGNSKGGGASVAEQATLDSTSALLRKIRDVDIGNSSPALSIPVAPKLTPQPSANPSVGTKK
jgi:pilus assembly protein CpaB